MKTVSKAPSRNGSGVSAGGTCTTRTSVAWHRDSVRFSTSRRCGRTSHATTNPAGARARGESESSCLQVMRTRPASVSRCRRGELGDQL